MRLFEASANILGFGLGVFYQISGMWAAGPPCRPLMSLGWSSNSCRLAFYRTRYQTALGSHSGHFENDAHLPLYSAQRPGPFGFVFTGFAIKLFVPEAGGVSGAADSRRIPRRAVVAFR
ncbi:hypothetical protein J6590_030227 [Homalodisca vitripennis]|nr:hypothetical protein J6590_030227 [Homalodisca vitripennis]